MLPVLAGDSQPIEVARATALARLARRLKWALVASSIAIVASAISFLITLNTYTLARRPYVGLSGDPVPHLGNPANRFGWSFFVTNSGAVPANVQFAQTARLRSAGTEQYLPLMGGGGGQLILMPGQTIQLDGDAERVPDIAVLSALAQGTTTLEVDHTLTYSATAKAVLLPDGRYSYRTTSIFDPRVNPPSFGMRQGTAD